MQTIYHDEQDCVFTLILLEMEEEEAKQIPNHQRRNHLLKKIRHARKRAMNQLFLFIS